jgi:hypothetical protein
MRELSCALTLIVSIALSGCANFTSMVGGFRLFQWKTEECTEYEQVVANAEFIVAAATELEAKAKITHTQLMQIDQDAGMYSARVKQLCDFFIHDRIKYNQYLDGVQKADKDYAKLRLAVLTLQNKH